MAISFLPNHFRSTDGNQRSARVAGVDVHVVNLTTTDGGRMTVSFYVTLFRDRGYIPISILPYKDRYVDRQNFNLNGSWDP